MKKEIIISIIIVIIVIIADLYTTKVTDTKVIEINNKLEIIENMIKDDNIKNTAVGRENIINRTREIKNIWEEHDDILSYYIEHNELEKAGTEIRSLYSYVESSDDEECLNSIARLKAILEYLNEKHDLKLNNFF